MIQFVCSDNSKFRYDGPTEDLDMIKYESALLYSHRLSDTDYFVLSEPFRTFICYPYNGIEHKGK